MFLPETVGKLAEEGVETTFNDRVCKLIKLPAKKGVPGSTNRGVHQIGDKGVRKVRILGDRHGGGLDVRNRYWEGKGLQ